jgi:hypothetical protein
LRVAKTSNEEIVRAYAAAHERRDPDAIGALRHADWTSDMPQTGERTRGDANDRAIMANWPGGWPDGEVRRIVGSEDRWVATPSWTMQRIAGEGDQWWIEATARYADASTWFAAGLLRLRDGLIAHETWYYAPTLEAPEWRAQWVERIDRPEPSDRR